MDIPVFSTITLITEVLVTTSVLYIFYSGYKKGRLPYALTAITLGYEVCFNISYMASRLFGGKNPSRLEDHLTIALAIFHGSFSLLMFLALLVFMVLAWINYKKDVNYFAAHKTFTIVFVCLWLVAVLSGIAFYFVSYF
jgi:hypothetical protein